MPRQRQSPSPLVLTNARIYTADANRSFAHEVEIRNGRFSRVDGIDRGGRGVDPNTLVIDLGGRLVLPGFIDAHMHPMGAASDLFEPSLRGCTSVAECLTRITAFLDQHPSMPFVTAWGWSAGLLDEVDLTAARLDEVVSDRPVALYDEGGHTMWVNSLALAAADISPATSDPEGGVIERLADGTPSGLLREAPVMWVERALPRRPLGQWVEALSHFQRDVAGPLGLTTVQEAVVRPGDSLLDAYEELQAAGELGVRVCVSLWIEEDRPLAEQVEALVCERARHLGPLVQARTAKLFADGVVEGHTAFLMQDYADRPGYRGKPCWEPERFIAASVAAAEAGFQLHYHAIGDAAVALSLDAIEAAKRAVNGSVERPLITHLQLVDSMDLPRMAELGVVVLPQPYWFVKDEMYREVQLPYLAQARADREYPMRSFFEQGLVVASASDYPVVSSPDPLRGIERGVSRSDGSGGVLWPDERASVEQMIDSFTISGAYANFLEGETGSIEVGKAADLVVVSDDILASPEALADSRVLLTLSGGKPVYAGEPFDGLLEEAIAQQAGGEERE